MNAVIDNIPEPEEDSEVTINSTQGNVQIVVSRPSVNTIIRSQGIQFQRPGRSVSLPTGLLMQVLGDGLGGGRATLSVTTVPSQSGTFQPESTFQVDSDQLDITLRSNGQTVVVENLNATNLVSFEVQRRVSYTHIECIQSSCVELNYASILRNFEMVFHFVASTIQLKDDGLLKDVWWFPKVDLLQLVPAAI